MSKKNPNKLRMKPYKINNIEIFRPDPHNLKSLKVFLETYKHLTTSEKAQLAGRSMRTIQKWRKIVYGTNNKPMLTSPKRPVTIYEVITDRNIWDNREWLYNKYVVERYSLLAIGKMVNRSHPIIKHRLKKFNIPKRNVTETVASSNKCCTREWVTEHYEIQGLTARECALLAGINCYTFLEWLIRFQIHIRERKEASSFVYYGDQSERLV